MNLPASPSTLPRRLAALALIATLGSALSACYVVPIDPSTGQGYPLATAGRDGAVHPGPAVVPVPVQPSGPPQATVLTVRLYPLNPQANKGGMIIATVADNNAGHGSFSVNYLGDNLQGESTRVDSNYAAFGRVYNEVLGTTQRGFGSGRRGIANAFGSRGVNAQCEYIITGPSTGTGACMFSDGAKYQMYFGS